MSKKIHYLTGCLSAAENLYADAVSGQLRFYDVKSFPTGIIPDGYLNKCSSVAVGITGYMNRDYLVAIPERPDKQKTGDGKDIDIDPVVFCFQPDTATAYPTGVALYHQNFSGRTTPLSGYDAFTVQDTLADLRTKLETGCYPVSGSESYYASAIQHAVQKLDSLAGKDIDRWMASFEASKYASDPLQ